uniref:Uncharacterized protein n=1 Tax=uncultured bacterium A1Q1_fos_36 TaxID=1256573 RepID=L7VX71_9BACT|nr:hypothetical protein [uncultured bacterium A1Q1_fos_36]
MPHGGGSGDWIGGCYCGETRTPLSLEGRGVGERVTVAFQIRVAPTTSALVPRVAVTFFCFAKRKSPKKRRPQAIRCFPAVLASGGRRRDRPKVALTRNQWAHTAPLGPPAAALLGANPWGPLRTDA